jgi:hypothetical protein
MTKDEALKLALEALENGMKFVWTDPEREAGFVAIDAIKEALAQPEQEPTTGNILMDSYNAMQSMKVEGPRHVVCQCDKCKAQPVQEPTCPECKAAVLYECVACSINNYPPKPEQEPVGQVGEDKHGLVGDIYDDRKVKIGDKLYTSLPQRQWVGLTEEEINACDPSEECWGLLKIARVIETKLKEKNT